MGFNLGFKGLSRFWYKHQCLLEWCVFIPLCGVWIWKCKHDVCFDWVSYAGIFRAFPTTLFSLCL